MVKLGVVITEHSYHRVPFLIDCLHALNNQTYMQFEVVIVDDSAKDRIFPFINQISVAKSLPTIVRHDKNYARYLRYPDETIDYYGYVPDNALSMASNPLRYPLAYIHNPVNYGASKSMNVGIDFMVKERKCDYIALHDGDDVSMPYRFAAQLQFMQQNNLNSCSGDKLEFGLGHLGRQSKFHPDPNSTRCQAAFWGSAFYKTNVMFKSSILDQFPNGTLFDDSYKGVGDDIVMNARLARVGELRVIPEILTYYRRHGDNLSSTEEQSNRFEREYCRSIKQVLNENCGIEDLGDKFYKDYYRNFHLQQPTDDFLDFFPVAEEAFLKCPFINYDIMKDIVSQVCGSFKTNLQMVWQKRLGLV